MRYQCIWIAWFRLGDRWVGDDDRWAMEYQKWFTWFWNFLELVMNQWKVSTWGLNTRITYNKWNVLIIKILMALHLWLYLGVVVVQASFAALCSVTLNCSFPMAFDLKSLFGFIHLVIIHFWFRKMILLTYKCKHMVKI